MNKVKAKIISRWRHMTPGDKKRMFEKIRRILILISAIVQIVSGIMWNYNMKQFIYFYISAMVLFIAVIMIDALKMEGENKVFDAAYTANILFFLYVFCH